MGRKRKSSKSSPVNKEIYYTPKRKVCCRQSDNSPSEQNMASGQVSQNMNGMNDMTAGRGNTENGQHFPGQIFPQNQNVQFSPFSTNVSNTHGYNQQVFTPQNTSNNSQQVFTPQGNGNNSQQLCTPRNAGNNGQQVRTPQSTDQFIDFSNKILNKLEGIEQKLSQLDSIQSTVRNITSRLINIDEKVQSLEMKMMELEISRSYDSQCVEEISKKQTEIDSMLSNLKRIEKQQAEHEQTVKADILDLKTRSMRDNLLFYGIPEENNETNEGCVDKVLELIGGKLEIENARNDIKLHRAHRIGRYNASKTRPIVAKFVYYPDRERVLQNAKKLSKPYGISQQYPQEIMDKRRRLIPIMTKARGENKEAYLRGDKLYINGRLYREDEANSN